MHCRFFVVLTASIGIAAASDIRVVEEIVAKVNGDIITRGEIERTRHALEAELRQQGMTGARLQQEIQQREQDALCKEIDQLLLVQRGKDLNINVDPEVTRRVAEIQTQSKISDPDKFQEWLREQLQGMSFEDFKSQLKNDLLTRKVIGQEIGSRIAFPEAEKKKFYEEHKTEFVRQQQVFLRQILLSTEGKTPEQVAAAEKKAKDLVARARKGEKFPEMARDNSDDTETAKNGGELPPYKPGEMRPEIEKIVFKEKKGYVTDPIKVPNGLLVLKIEERFEKGQAPYDEVEGEITERMAMPQMETKTRAYLTKLREQAFLEIKPGYVDSGAAPGKDTTWKDPAQLKPETTTKQEVLARQKKKLLWMIPVGPKKPEVPAATPGQVPAPAAVPAPAPAASPAPK